MVKRESKRKPVITCIVPDDNDLNILNLLKPAPSPIPLIWVCVHCLHLLRNICSKPVGLKENLSLLDRCFQGT